jgi:integrase
MPTNIVQLPRPAVPAAPKSHHLTDALAKRLPAPPKSNRLYWDDTADGLALRVTAAGARAYVLFYRVRSTGQRKLYTIGRIESWRVTAAREEARRLKRLVDQGEDPLGDIEASRVAPDMGELCDRFLAEHVERKNRKSTADAYKLMVDLHVRPHFGSTKVADVTFADCEALHHKVTKAGTPIMANRVIRMLSKMFSLSRKWAMRSDNPTKGVEHNPEVRRRRYMRGDELTRLNAALDAHGDQQSANIIRLCLLCGCRKGEALSCRWSDLSLDDEDGAGPEWTKPASVTKQKAIHHLPLSTAAVALLKGIRAQQLKANPRGLGEWVFPGVAGQHQLDVKKSWKSLCRAAGISQLRLHDLRHHAASVLISRGASLPLVGAVLGHASPVTTSRYAHMMSDPVRAAVEDLGDVVTGNGPKSEPPRPAKRRK